MDGRVLRERPAAERHGREVVSPQPPVRQRAIVRPLGRRKPRQARRTKHLLVEFINEELPRMRGCEQLAPYEFGIAARQVSNVLHGELTARLKRLHRAEVGKHAFAKMTADCERDA